MREYTITCQHCGCHQPQRNLICARCHGGTQGSVMGKSPAHDALEAIKGMKFVAVLPKGSGPVLLNQYNGKVVGAAPGCQPFIVHEDRIELVGEPA